MTQIESSVSSSEDISSNDTLGDIALQVPEVRQYPHNSQSSQIFTELLELKKYEDGYQVHTSAKTHFLSRNSLDFDISKMLILWKSRF